MTRVRAFVGRRRYAGSAAGYSDQYLNSEFKASIAELLENFDKWTQHMEIESPQILKEAVKPVFDRSQELVPVDTSDLKDSGYIATRMFRGSAQVEVGYAKGGNPDYAIYVHELTTYEHEAPTQAKFLQQPLEEGMEDIKALAIELTRHAAGV